MSEYDIKYYSHYEDIEEPDIIDFSFEKSEFDIDKNFKQQDQPFDVGEISVIEHNPILDI